LNRCIKLKLKNYKFWGACQNSRNELKFAGKDKTLKEAAKEVMDAIKNNNSQQNCKIHRSACVVLNSKSSKYEANI